MNIIITHLPPKPGYSSQMYAGRQVVTSCFIEALLKYTSQHRIIVYTPDSHTEMYTRYTSVYSDTERLELLNASEIRHSIKDGDPTVIHTLITSLRDGMHLRWLCGSQLWPVLGITHDLSSNEVYDNLLITLMARPTKYDAFVCTTKCAQGVAERLIDSASTSTGYESQIQLPIIPLGVEVNSFQTCNRDVARNVWQCQQGHIVFLYLGRLSHTMKADLLPLLTAFSHVRRKYPAQLIIAGSVTCPREEHSVNRIQGYISELDLNKDISVHTNISAEQRVELLSAVDVFVSPADSYQESFGLALLEAMAVGLPIIASDWNGYREVIEESTTGLLVETTMPKVGLSDVSQRMLFEEPWWSYGKFSQSVSIDINQLVKAMISLIIDPDLRHQMGSSGQKRVQQHYKWENIIYMYEKEWERLTMIAKSSKRPQKSSLFWYDRTHIFQMHPSTFFDLNSIVQKKENEPHSLYPLDFPPPFFESKILKNILELIQEPTHIRDLLLTELNTEQYIAYLLKQGYLEIVDEPK